LHDLVADIATSDNLEIQNFIANRLWALGMRDEAAEVHERAFNRALALIPNSDIARTKKSSVWSSPLKAIH
jgi:hypothetical protein